MRIKVILKAYFLMSLGIIFLLSSLAPSLHGEDSTKPLQIGIYANPPYAIKNDKGAWEGISVTLWNDVMSESGLKSEFVELPMDDIIPAIASGKIDAAVSEEAIDADAEKIVDFTQSYLISSIGLAVAQADWKTTWKNVYNELFNWTLGKVALGTIGALFFISLLIWLVEKKPGTGHFQEGIYGLGSALWFGAVTMSTVGYGDKTPSTLSGRLIAIFWMIFGVILVSLFTATLTSSMSATRVNLDISNISDFNHLTCGVLQDSKSSKILRKIGINVRNYETIEEALEELTEKNIDAVVGDKNTLLYFQKQFGARKPPVHFLIPKFTLRESVLAFPIRDDHPDIEKINQAILKITASPEWRSVLAMWLGVSAEISSF
jgi:ABC-type amino acid transport substrate-binding protein